MSAKIQKKINHSNHTVTSIKEPTASYDSSTPELHCTMCSGSKDLSHFKQGLICTRCIEKIKKTP